MINFADNMQILSYTFFISGPFIAFFWLLILQIFLSFMGFLSRSVDSFTQLDYLSD